MLKSMVNELKRIMPSSRLAAILLIILLAITLLYVVATEHQQYSTQVNDSGSFSVVVDRTTFFPQTCVEVRWQSENLGQVLLNGNLTDLNGQFTDCNYGDVISTFLVVSQDHRSTQTHNFRIAGILGLGTWVSAIAVVLVAGTYVRQKWVSRPIKSGDTKTAAQESKTQGIAFLGYYLIPLSALVSIMAFLQLVYPIALRDSFVTWLTYWLYLVLGVILPGTLLIIRFTKWRADVLTWLGIGWALGHALELFSLQIAKWLGSPSFFILWVPLAYILFLSAKSDWDARSKGSITRWHWVAVLLIFLVSGAIYMSLNLAELSPRPPYISDTWFHISNAHEFRDHPVMQDPRLAGQPFNYHVFGYAPYAAASLITGAPIANILARFGGLSAVWLLGLLVFNLSRYFGRGSIIAGLTGALLVLTPIDVPALFSIDLSTNASLLYYGVYFSSTTLAGHIYLAALLLPLLWFFQGAPTRALGLLMLFAAAGAGSKSMFGPLILCGVLGLIGWHILRYRRLDKRLLVLLVALAIPILLITAQLVFGEGSYAESVRWSYGDYASYTKFYESLRPYLRNFPTRTLWFMGFTFLFLLGAIAATWRERRNRDHADYIVFAWMVFIASLVPSMGTTIPGASQLFFLYYSLAGLATLAGFGLVWLVNVILSQRWGRVSAAIATFIVLMAAQFAFVPPNLPFEQQMLPIISVFSRAYRWLPIAFADESHLPPPEPLSEAGSLFVTQIDMTDSLRKGLEWARLNLPPDSVFIVNITEISAYAALSEQRAYYETEIFTAYAHSVGGRNPVFESRRALIADWQSGASDVIDRMRSAGITHIFVDTVNGFRAPSYELSPIFENDDFAIYAL
jgi:hypothetical protein